MKRILLPLFILSLIMFLTTSCLFSQDLRARQAQTAGINVLIGGTIGGIGAMINKKPGEKLLPVFLKGFGIGGVGGGICYGGKALLWQVSKQNDLKYVWPARIINSVGSSLIENAASNKSFYNSFALDMWVFRLDVKDKFSKAQFRLMPATAVSFAYNWSTYGAVDINKTLATGSIYIAVTEKYKGNLFKFDTISISVNSEGLSALNVIIINEPYYNHFNITNKNGKVIYETIGHELVHTFQSRQVQTISKLYNRWDAKEKSEYKFYHDASKYLYMDLNGFEIVGTVLMGTINHDNRPHEREATLISSQL